jgi:hypothetical protein
MLLNMHLNILRREVLKTRTHWLESPQMEIKQGERPENFEA